MRATIVIPSYWGRSSGEGLNLQDAVYDHPTPLDSEGTLARALESISVIENRDFNVVVLAVSTTPEVAERVEDRVKAMVATFRGEYPIACVSHSFEESIRGRLETLASKAGRSPDTDVVSLRGYSNIRNMCLIAAELAGSEVAVLFDDDQVYEDPRYLDKVFENIGTVREFGFVGALAGYYLRPEGGYLVPPPVDWWLSEWPMVRAMNEAFAIIGEEPRLKPTPFVFGGNMCVHRDVFRRIPFDPNVRRGEDIDYLTNCKFFGVDFMLDNQLSIMHLPPSGHPPAWQHFQENVFRFIYTREKLRRQEPVEGLRMVSVEELDPYPGMCMRDDLEDLVFRTSVLMGMHFLEQGDKTGFRESMQNIHIARFDAVPSANPFQGYLDYQARWEEFMAFLAEDEVLSEQLLAGM
jgi:hypothetical protein